MPIGYRLDDGMPLISRYILAYAAVLLLPEVIDLTAVTPADVISHARISGWVGGSVALAAGLASAQRRRLLRVGGTLIAMFFALALAGIYAWSAAEVWSLQRRSTLQGWTLSSLALASILLVWLIFRLRPRDTVASRGYAVLTTAARR